MKKKKILFVVPVPPPFAGPEVSSKILLESPLRESFDITHVLSNVNTENKYKGKISLRSCLRFLAVLIRTMKAIFKERPAFVYTLLSQNVTGFIRDSILVILSRICGRKVIVHFRGSNFHNFYRYKSNFFKWYIRKILNLCAMIIIQASWLKEWFSSIVPQEKLKVIYNAIPNTELIRLKSIERKVEKKDVTILFMNHLSVPKGLLVLLEAAKDIVCQENFINFNIAGDIITKESNIFFDQNGERIKFGDLESTIDEIKKDKVLSRCIRFLGEIRDTHEKDKLFTNADVFTLPSYSEGCPMSVLEAMAAGLPVLVTRVGALQEIIKDGINGFFLNTGDVQDLKEKILKIAQENESREAMGKANKSMIKSEFNIEKVVSKLRDVFSKI